MFLIYSITTFKNILSKKYLSDSFKSKKEKKLIIIITPHKSKLLLIQLK